MTRTQIYLPEEQKRLLKRIAVKEDTTFSEVVRELIEKGLQIKKSQPLKKKLRKKNAAQVFLQAAKRAEKEGWGGPWDGSVNHDKYIYGLRS